MKEKYLFRTWLLCMLILIGAGKSWADSVGLQGLPTAKNIKAFKALNNDTEAMLMLEDAKVTFVDTPGGVCYVEDASGAITFEISNVLNLQPNTILNGSVIGKKTTGVNSTVKFAITGNTNTSGIQTTVNFSGNQPTLTTMEKARQDSMLMRYLKLENVTVSKFTETPRLASRSAQIELRDLIDEPLTFNYYQVNSNGQTLYLRIKKKSIDLERLLDGKNKQFKLASIAGIIEKSNSINMVDNTMMLLSMITGNIPYVLSIINENDIKPYEDQTKNKLDTAATIADFKKLALGEDAVLKLTDAYVTVTQDLDTDPVPVPEARSAIKQKRASALSFFGGPTTQLVLQDATGAIPMMTGKFIYDAGKKLNGFVSAKSLNLLGVITFMFDNDLTDTDDIDAVDEAYVPTELDNINDILTPDSLFKMVRIGRSSVRPLLLEGDAEPAAGEGSITFKQLITEDGTILLSSESAITGETLNIPDELEYIEGIVSMRTGRIIDGGKSRAAAPEVEMEPAITFLLMPTKFKKYVTEVTEYKVDSEEEGEEIESGEQRQVAGVIMTAIDDMPVTDDPLTIGEGEDAELFPSKAEGTSFQFDATRNGSLTVYLEKKKGQTITVTEDGKAMKDFNGIAMTDQAIVVPVKGGKTYVLSTAQPTLNLRGFSFESDGTSGDIARNIAVFKSLYDGETDAEATLLLNDAMVTYIKGDNVFVEDESGATVFYKTNIQFYKDQKLNGSINGISTANGFMPQLDRTAETTYRTVKAVKETAVAKAVTIEEATLVQNLARFVKIENVKTTKDEHGFTILLDEENDQTIRVADHFNVFYTLPEDIESIEGIIGVSDEGEPMLWPTSKEGILAVVPQAAATLAHTASSSCAGDGNAYTSTVDAEKEHVNNEAFSGAAWQGAAYMDFDINIPEGKSLTGATLKFTVIGESRRDRAGIVYGANAGEELDYTAMGAGDVKVNLAGTKLADVTFPKGSSKLLELDVTEYVKNIVNGGQGHVVFKVTGNPGGGDIYGKGSEEFAPVLELTAVDADMITEYTVNFVDAEGNVLKEAAAHENQEVGKTATASAAETAAFKNEDGSKKYIYVSGNEEIELVKEAESNAINLVFREAAKWSYTVYAIDSEENPIDVIKSGKDFEGEVVNVPTPRRLNVEGTIYASATSGSQESSVNITLDGDNKSADVVYTATDNDNVVYFSEAEDIETLTYNAAQYVQVRCSNKAGGYAAEDAAIIALRAGTYTITAASYASKDISFVFKAAGQEVMTHSGTGGWSETKSEAFTLTEDATLTVVGGNANYALDYLYIQSADGGLSVGISDLSDKRNDGSVYNLNGQKVNSLKKGLYIVNGHKVVIK